MFVDAVVLHGEVLSSRLCSWEMIRVDAEKYANYNVSTTRESWIHIMVKVALSSDQPWIPPAICICSKGALESASST